MPKITAIFSSSYSIHEDGWTETLAGLKFLISTIEEVEKEGDSFHSVILLRLVFVSSSYLAEQIFNSSINKYIEGKEEFRELASELSLKKVGISKAMKEWPKILTGTKLNLGEGALQSLREITNKRNDIIHKLSDLTQYPNPSETVRKIVYTATEACKLIENHFFPDEEFSYKEWLEQFPPEKTDYYKKI